MQNTTQINEQVEQLRLASLELAHGCGLAIEIGVTVEDIALLAVALEEMHGHAKKLLASMTIDPALDHDGDTQPNNERPEQPDEPSWPMRCGFVAHSADGSRELVCQRELGHEGPHYAGPVAPLYECPE